MKILFVTSIPLEYNSSANMRNLALIQGMIDLGNTVYTLSPSPNANAKQYDKSTVPEALHERRFWMDTPEYNKSIETTPTFLDKVRGKIKKIMYDVYVSVSVYDPRARIANKIPAELASEKFDVIISSSDPKSSHLIVENLKTTNPSISEVWIQYWGDPFANDINRLSKLPTKVIEKEEYRILQKADMILYVSPVTFSVMKKKYPQLQQRMLFEPVPFRKKIEYTTLPNDIFTIGYFGDYYSKDRNITPLLNGVMNESCKLLLVGNTDIQFENTAGNVVKLGRQEVSEIRKMEENVDLLVCVCNKKGTQIPGKIYHYSATNKAILLIVDGEYKTELVNYFKGFNRFYICENDKDSIIETLRRIKSEKKNFAPLNDFASSAIANRILTKLLKKDMSS